MVNPIVIPGDGDTLGLYLALTADGHLSIGFDVDGVSTEIVRVMQGLFTGGLDDPNFKALCRAVVAAHASNLGMLARRAPSDLTNESHN